MYRNTLPRLDRGHRILLYVAAVAFFIITLDGFIQSGRLTSLFGEDTQLADVLRNWGKHKDDGGGDVEAPELVARYAMIPIDHENPSEGSYSNRYWVNDRFYRPGGPVIVYDAGEGDASSSVERFLQRPSSFLGELLQEFHGVGILWEHRYYGESLPFPVNESTPVSHFRFLTLNQSLADLPYFARTFHLQSYPDADVTPTSTPWVMTGCSYSGTRSALSRLVHPETFFAAFAGSPVVEFTPGIDDFYEEIYRDLVDHGYTNCTRDLHAIMEFVDSQLDLPDGAVSIKQQFFGPGAESNSNEDFASALSFIYAYHKTWGIGRGKPSLAEVCDFLERDPTTHQLADTYGQAVAHGSDGARLMTERLSSFPPLLGLVNKLFETNCSKNSQSPAVDCDLSARRRNASSVAWNYQQCSEMGYLVHQYPSSRRLVSKYWGNIERQASMCQKFFPAANPEVLMSELRQRVRTANDWFGGWDMRPSNVFWTTGEYDEYRSASPLAREKVNFGKVKVTQDVPKCNTSTGPDTVFGLVLPGAVHCGVIGKNDTLALDTRKTFAKALHEWLKCF